MSEVAGSEVVAVLYGLPQAGGDSLCATQLEVVHDGECEGIFAPGCKMCRSKAILE
jgi:hypothetical protein